jgi:serine/threonine protein kinase
MAPEVLTEGQVSKASDVYAYGGWPGLLACQKARTCFPLLVGTQVYIGTGVGHLVCRQQAASTRAVVRCVCCCVATGITLWELFTGGHAFKGVPKQLLGHQVTVEHRWGEGPE